MCMHTSIAARRTDVAFKDLLGLTFYLAAPVAAVEEALRNKSNSVIPIWLISAIFALCRFVRTMSFRNHY